MAAGSNPVEQGSTPWRFAISHTSHLERSVAEFDREPCFWTSPTPGYNTADRQRTFMKDGKRVTERFPQKGHAGDYDDPNRRKASGTRYIRVIDHYGNEIFHTLTNAAAHLDHTAPFGQYMLGKARAFGWFMPGQCPCALLSTGELHRDHLVDRSLMSATACQPGSYSYENQCPHSKAEQAARKAQNKAVQDEREARTKGDGMRQLEATELMTRTVGDAVAKLVEMQTEKPRKSEK